MEWPWYVGDVVTSFELPRQLKNGDCTSVRCAVECAAAVEDQAGKRIIAILSSALEV